MNKKTLILCIIFLILIISTAFVAYNFLSNNYIPGEIPITEKTQSPGYTAPDFAVLDSNNNNVKLSDFKDKPVIVNFWATWCGPCRMEFPYFNEAYIKYKDKIHFMMVNLTDGQRDTVDNVKNFISENGYVFPVYYDVAYIASNAYNTYSIPVTVFIDKNGKIIKSHTGAMNKETLNSYINLLLGE